MHALHAPHALTPQPASLTRPNGVSGATGVPVEPPSTELLQSAVHYLTDIASCRWASSQARSEARAQAEQDIAALEGRGQNCARLRHELRLAAIGVC